MQSGSLVECIIKGEWSDAESILPKDTSPKKGEIYIVNEIDTFRNNDYISLTEFSSDDFFHIECFREIQPPMDIEKELRIEEPKIIQV